MACSALCMRSRFMPARLFGIIREPGRHRSVGAELDRSREAHGHRRIASDDLFADNLPEGSGPRGALRVIRGGSWNNKPRNVRSANRNRNEPDNRNNNLGFRLAQSTRAAWCRARSRSVHGRIGRGARVSMSLFPGPAETGAPNSLAWDGVARG
jgi:Sulfatase-modifying factor enzyme 1